MVGWLIPGFGLCNNEGTVIYFQVSMMADLEGNLQVVVFPMAAALVYLGKRDPGLGATLKVS